MSESELNAALGVSEADIVTKPFPFRPLHNQVVIKILWDDSVISSLWIPESANNRDLSAIGLVIARGPGHRLRRRIIRGRFEEFAWNEGYCEMGIEPGDYVACARNSGEQHEFNGQSYLVTPVEHVFAVLEGYKPRADADFVSDRNFGQEAYLDRKYKRPASERPHVSGKHGNH